MTTLTEGDTITLDITGPVRITVERIAETAPAPSQPPITEEPTEPTEPAPTEPTEPAPTPPDVVIPPASDDTYARWEGQLHYGNRLSSAEEINASALRNFGFDGTPYHTIDNGVLRFNFRQGEKALPLGSQIRLSWPELSPTNAQMATVSWALKFDPRGYSGGKMVQLPNRYDQINIEHNPPFHRDPETWMLVPATRVYGDGVIGGNGQKDLLSSNDWASRNIQPALDAPGRNYDYVYARDHITGTRPRAFLVRPGQWTRYIYTLDWREEPYRIWLWMESEDTPRTLVLADPDDHTKGFKLHFSESARNVLSRLWFEFNNSSGLNAVDFNVWARGVIVLKDVLGQDL